MLFYPPFTKLLVRKLKKFHKKFLKQKVIYFVNKKIETFFLNIKKYNVFMILLTGASASGKTEVAKLLAKKYQIKKIITTTTREKRDGEVDGVDYFFVTKEKFEQMINNGEFVEYTLFNGNLYGSTKDQIADNRCIVIDPVGLKSYLLLNNPNIITFILEADEKTREERMVSRGDKPEKIKSRIANDRVAFKKENIPEVDYHIDSSNKHSIEEITDLIYKIYMERKSK